MPAVGSAVDSEILGSESAESDFALDIELDSDLETHLKTDFGSGA